MVETFKDVLELAAKIHLFEHKESEHHSKYYQGKPQIEDSKPEVVTQDSTNRYCSLCRLIIFRNSISVEESANKEIAVDSVHKKKSLTEGAE